MFMDFRMKKHGFTLVEIAVVMTIIIILIAISIPSYFVLRNKVSQKTCYSNKASIVRMYEIEKASYSEEYMSLEQFLTANNTYREACPSGGKYSTSTDNTISCDKHPEDTKNDETGETSEETIPWI
jgi:prepilin-type N-terminal cleavage/methylation domain-containing protein